MIQEDKPDPTYPAQLVYRTFKDKYTGLEGHPVPMYVVKDTRYESGMFMTISKQEYFREVLRRKVRANHVQEE